MTEAAGAGCGTARREDIASTVRTSICERSLCIISPPPFYVLDAPGCAGEGNLAANWQQSIFVISKGTHSSIYKIVPNARKIRALAEKSGQD